MFDVTPEDIARLNDEQLRELIGRLCEAELTRRGLSPAAVTWGGVQTAADGGLDVRVSLPPGTAIDGYIPRGQTGFQVKVPDMPRNEILSEMRPHNTLRPIIETLAATAGAYVIVSAHGSTSDTALRARRDAMREALFGNPNAADLVTDFFDRTRIAGWVRQYPGIVAWVRERVGRGLSGWQPYGPWSGTAEGAGAEYLLDETLRIRLGFRQDAPPLPVMEAIDELRDQLVQPGKVVRLVGLSGVGKTRLAQALFDMRIGERPLPPELAVYTNLSDNPSPLPMGLASDLLANRRRTILIVDNCPPDLHHRLAQLCGGPESSLSVLSIEYDVREDQPEATQVVTLEPSSEELIEQLVGRRYPHISQVDRRTLAHASGGNARIAIALADTVGHSDTLAGLSNEELFDRLFWQRQAPDADLLNAACVMALVYSFQGEALSGGEAELSRLAELAGQPVVQLLRHASELLRRDLMQRRGPWRAVLPHALANRLAKRALEDIPYDLIHRHLVDGSPRLARSFTRRLSYLHEHPRAIAIAERWLDESGPLGDVGALNAVGEAMLENLAPVQPAAALAALERAASRRDAAAIWHKHRLLLRSIAYDPLLFVRSCDLLVRAATDGEPHARKEVTDVFASLFPLILSGTHAALPQRLEIIERLLASSLPEHAALGLQALDKLMETRFSSGYPFEFGARSRDYGYRPASAEEGRRWFSESLAALARWIDNTTHGDELKALLARNFRDLWTFAGLHSELEALMDHLAARGFWRDGWAACRQALQFDRERLDPEALARLVSLEQRLRPASLQDRIRGVVLGQIGSMDLEDPELDDPAEASNRLEATARELGEQAAEDAATLSSVLSELLGGGIRVASFGQGVARAGTPGMWQSMVEGLRELPPGERNVALPMGYLTELANTDRSQAEVLLDNALEEPVLQPFLPLLQAAVGLDSRGVQRLLWALQAAVTPVHSYHYLAGGTTTDDVPGAELAALLLSIADQPGGVTVAADILYMRFYTDRRAGRDHEADLLAAGRALLQQVAFGRERAREDHHLTGIAKACLIGTSGASIAAQLAMALREAQLRHEASPYDYDELLETLLILQPLATLDALFSGSARQVRATLQWFDYLEQRRDPVRALPVESLRAWCEGDPDIRFPMMAEVVPYSEHPADGAPPQWSPQALMLLRHAPEPSVVLASFIGRFAPSEWSGSRAAIIESHAQLLNDLERDFPELPGNLLTQAKERLAQEVVAERQREMARDRPRDERFE